MNGLEAFALLMWMFMGSFIAILIAICVPAKQKGAFSRLLVFCLSFVAYVNTSDAEAQQWAGPISWEEEYDIRNNSNWKRLPSGMFSSYMLSRIPNKGYFYTEPDHLGSLKCARFSYDDIFCYVPDELLQELRRSTR